MVGRRIALLVALALLAPPGTRAEAAFPGANGKIAYVNQSPDLTQADIYLVDPDGSGATRVIGGRAPAWTASGVWLAFGNSHIQKVLFDGRFAADLTPNQFQDLRDPAWSPDGLQL